MSTGRVVASKYCLLNEVGRGGMGSVWVAEHLGLRSRVAVKLINPDLASSTRAMRRFEQEARAAATIRSPHVVQVLDFGVDAGSPYLVMELLDGESLGSYLRARERMPPRETWKVIDHVGRAMSRAHAQGFVHRDLKPDNIFLVDDDEEYFVKVLDFGIAKALDPGVLGGGPLTNSGALLGTPHHMSPEQAESRTVDSRADLWSMGVVTFECLTGLLPFEGDSLPAVLRSICYDAIVVPSSVAPVPPGFDAWFARAVARDPERRFQTARELVEDLEPLIGPLAPDDWFEAPRKGLPPPPRGPEPALRLETFPGTPPERREEIRIPSSIPAGINRKRDLRHTALIHNASRGGALLVTQHHCQPNQQLVLTLHVRNPHEGEIVFARVVRVIPREDPLWQFEVGVQFETPLSEELLHEIEQRAKRGR
ncbi:MAG TPA: serine/threonine-protein kinase [Polyangiaceae bacterium]